MKLSISKKFCKRSIKCLAMFAPLAYLFGSLFFALNGSNGNSVFEITYNTGENYYAGEQVATPVVGEAYFVKTLTRDNLSTLGFNSFDLPAGSTLSLDPSFEVTFSSITINTNAFCLKNPVTPAVASGPTMLFVMSTKTDILVDYFYIDHYYEGFPFAPYCYSVLGGAGSSIVESDNFNIVTDFFLKENFLQQWGENAISDNPKGFALFGTFVKYIDDNMLHLSDSQIGLMAYGYLYYTLHVLIAFFAFDILGFIPLFLQRVTDKIGGTEDD